jgi:hypothetical protein
MLDKKQLAILAFPRSGTKLLADIFQQQGYHNFGEFFNTNNVKLVGNEILHTERLSVSEQKKLNKQRSQQNRLFTRYNASFEIYDRLIEFDKLKHIEPSIVTIWLENCLRFPLLVSSLNDRFFLCIQRKNRLEQLLSRFITKKNFNFDNEVKSSSVNINISRFEEEYSRLCQVYVMQNFLVNSNNGVFVDFDELINGTANLGFDYSVKSEDQHSRDELYNLIINLEEVQNKFKELELAYGTANTNHGFTGLW